MVMEVKKSQDLQLASKEHRKANGIVSIWVQRPENQESWWYHFKYELRVWKQESPMSQLENICRKWILPYPAFPSIQTFNELEEAHPHWGWPSALFSLSIQRKQNKINTLTDTSRIMFNQISAHHVAQSTWHIQLIITNPPLVNLAPYTSP